MQDEFLPGANDLQKQRCGFLKITQKQTANFVKITKKIK